MTYFTKHLTRCKKTLSLTHNDIHLWMTKPEQLAGDDKLLASYANLLSPNELAKQQRYKFAKDRHDALITRAFIRDLLSYYADIAPQAWQFEKGSKNKPEVVNCPLPLRFNISHTKNLIICAVTLEDDIGCDVENTARDNDVSAIADRYFSSTETDELFSLPAAQHRHRFFDYWTLKESYIKAWGLGLAIPLTDFSFNINSTTTKHHDLFTIKSDIGLSFAKHRVDTAEVWRSWLVYPTTKIDEKQQHRIALSVRAKANNQQTAYQLRFFDTLPLLGYREL